MSNHNKGHFEPCWTPYHGDPGDEQLDTIESPYQLPCPICGLTGHHITSCKNNIRTFETGATRDTETGKLDYEAFLSPLVLRRYAEYMDKHRVQSDGTVRDGDNWQKGFPLEVYMKSGWRHFMDWWTEHRDMVLAEGKDDVSMMEEAICALLFNGMGYLHELLADRVSD